MPISNNSSSAERAHTENKNTITPAECFPVSVYINDELSERGWGIEIAVSLIPQNILKTNRVTTAVWLHLLCNTESWYGHEILFDEDDAEILSWLFGTSQSLWLNLHNSFSIWRKQQSPQRLAELSGEQGVQS